MPENDSFGESQVVFMVLGQKYVTYVNDGHLLDPIGEVEDMLLAVTQLFMAFLFKCSPITVALTNVHGILNCWSIFIPFHRNFLVFQQHLPMWIL